MLSPALPRRQTLKAAGATVALPMLESVPSHTAAADVAGDEDPKAKRLVCVGAYLGLHQPSFFPEQDGRDYEVTPLLEPLARHRDDFSVLSGLDHRAKNGHGNWANFLCGQNVGEISLDQLVANRIGEATRFASLQLSAGKYSRNMSYTADGVALPMIQRPSVVYGKLFATPEDRKRSEYLLRSGQSSLDKVTEEARRLQREVSGRDRQKLDEYFGSVRAVETRMRKHLEGIDDPIPRVDYELPDYDPVAPTLMLECESIMYDLMALALETDQTRVVTMFLAGLGQVFTIDGETLQAGYHALSHHGNDPEKIRDLVRVEREHMTRLATFLDQLKAKTDADGRSLLDSTIVLWGTGMGDASRHSNRNVPTFVAGGGLRHGRHVAIDPDGKTTPPRMLGDLYVTLLHQLGIEADRFSNATHDMDEVLA